MERLGSSWKSPRVFFFNEYETNEGTLRRSNSFFSLSMRCKYHRQLAGISTELNPSLLNESQSYRMPKNQPKESIPPHRHSAIPPQSLNSKQQYRISCFFSLRQSFHWQASKSFKLLTSFAPRFANSEDESWASFENPQPDRNHTFQRTNPRITGIIRL